MRQFILFPGLFFIVSADECSSVCELVPGSCSEAGSYCKESFACMDLFWFDVAKTVLCNQGHSGCPEGSPLLCYEAVKILSGESDLPAAAVVPPPPEPGLTDTRPSPKGIMNLGAMCYFNAVAQVLSHSRAVKRLLSLPHSLEDVSRAGRVSNAFRSFLRQISEEQAEPANPREFLTSVREYAGEDGMEEGTADDASRAMSFVINALAESVPAADDAVSLKTELKSACIGCDFSGKSFQSTNIPIFLQLFEAPNEVALSSLIQDYFASTLPEDFRCEGCGVRGSIKITPVIIAVPDLLVLTLSRYAYGAEKKTTSVAIPDGLNLKVFADTILGADELEYKLIGVVRHAGGHYTCDFFENFQWFHADDATVVPIEAPLKTGADPFLLVYERSVEE